MSITLTALMKQRYDTAANWTAQNPTLLAGEFGIESDTKKWKVGTGATAWTSLVYAIGGTYPIVNADIAAGAGIVDTKLATIATAGKVSNSATTAASANTASAIVARDASGNFTAGTITAALTGAASSNVLKAGDTMTGALAVTAGTAALPGIAVSGDTNTGIYSPGADQLAISTGGTGRVFVDGGWLGVGPPSPAGALDVAVGGAGPARIIFSQVSDNPYIDIYRATGSGSNFAGFRLSTPSVSGELAFSNATGALIGSHSFVERLRITSTGALNFVGAGTAGSTQAVSFNGSAPVNSLVIDSLGKVGIGTSNPGKALEIAGASSTGGELRLTNTNDTLTTNGVIGNIEFYSLDGDRPAFSTQLAAYIKAICIDSFGRDSALTFGTNAVNTTVQERLRITPEGRVGIGTTSAQAILHASKAGAEGFEFNPGYEANRNLTFHYNRTGSNYALNDQAASQHVFRIGSISTEAVRIDSSGRLLVGTSTSLAIGSSANGQLQIADTTVAIGSISTFTNGASGAYLMLGKSRGGTVGTYTVVQSGDQLGVINFAGADGVNLQAVGASIASFVDGTPGAGDIPGRLVFSTTADGAASPTEAMRITSAQNIRIGTTGDGSGSTTGRIRLTGNAGGINSIYTEQAVSGGYNFVSSTVSNGGTYYHANFLEGGTQRGSITSNGVATVYATTSDYRLKENVAPVSDGITRFKQLKPSRFNFISHPDRTIDGFLAHEAQEIVPECVIGTKDEVDADGNPIYQGIDQSKLVPLLTAALQEAIARIETLETRLSALEGK